MTEVTASDLMIGTATDFFIDVDENYGVCFCGDDDALYGRVTIKYKGNHGNETTQVVRTLQEFNEFISDRIDDAIKYELGAISIGGSSSLDFPEEYTNDPKTIALAHAIRNQ